MLVTAFQNSICPVLIELSVMAYDQILNRNQLIANLGEIKNWQVSFVVEYIYVRSKTVCVLCVVSLLLYFPK